MSKPKPKNKRDKKDFYRIVMTGRPPKYTRPAQLEKKITEYFEYCDEVGKKLTVTGLALWLGFESRQSMYDYKKNDPFSYIIKNALSIIGDMYEQKLLSQNVTGAIFALKNMGWKDKTEVKQESVVYEVRTEDDTE